MNRKTRREFLDRTLRGAVTASAGLAVLKPGALRAGKVEVPRRTLGKTGERVSIIGLGGYHLGMLKDPAESVRIIGAAIGNGINFLDNSWDYFDGESEIRMGKAVRGQRQQVFLMTKHNGRDKKTALRHLEASLRRLQTDYVDLWQFHSIQTEEDPDWIFAPHGALEAVYLAKKQGKVRYVGFTGHKHPAFHLKMLAKPYAWDAVQMPLNVLDPHFRSFERQVLPVLVEREIGVIGMKPMAFGNALKTKAVTPIECLRYALSLPTSTVVTGCESLEILEQAIRIAATFKPLREKELASLRDRARPFGMTGQYEPFKVTTTYDNPPASPPPYEA